MATVERVCKRCGTSFQSAGRGGQWSNFCSAVCVEAHKVALGRAQASRLEIEFAELLAEVGLVGVAQFPLGPYVIDLAFPQAMLLVEVDGEAFHTSSVAQVRDDRKDAQARERGWRLLRVPQGVIVNAPQEAVRMVMDAFSGVELSGNALRCSLLTQPSPTGEPDRCAAAVLLPPLAWHHDRRCPAHRPPA